MSLTGGPHDALCTPDFPALLAEIALRTLISNLSRGGAAE
jgi:hypothetical protein